AILSST
nr:Chain A, AILSST hexapeptide segment from Islet Amyloid Polypeptide [synthetic construct]3FOD_B Chain B, AILSST hexapeptide segment from Islet Amyloid Polypeptide [synthetic construct]3FOD_C Chain C, AILSST hexapeptide segment from Islet Amyloid Polypeptide [synthetic construct]3FOD_D Chain D, AILSST hexapeptide segment from Islet Amyloid Polypeptide [synthetic construct]3FOD_E Chain E, AILSST hexapeptide segment from Islet Amyloid Polypeptide [synthetic construct]3FOD_F Chain F, AILSST hexa